MYDEDIQLPASLIFIKPVDRSLLYDGMAIPQKYQQYVYKGIGVQLAPGESTPILVIIDDVEYSAKLTHIAPKNEKYSNHSQILQIRYSKSSPIAKRLQEIFHSSYSIVQEFDRIRTDKSKRLRIPTELQEWVGVYSTGRVGVVGLRCQTLDGKSI